jgi:hypothetical protein
MARSAECKCTESFTCGHCLQNAKPGVFTPTDNSWMWSPAQCAYRVRLMDERRKDLKVEAKPELI